MSDNANATKVGKLTGLYKEVYADDLKTLLPEIAKIQGMVKFLASKRLGKAYHQPVIVSDNHGFTHMSAGQTDLSLNPAISMTTEDAVITAPQIVLAGELSVEAAKRAMSGKAAFKNATKLLLKNLVRSMRKRVEIQCLYGSDSIGSVKTAAASNATTISLNKDDFAPGHWVGSENMPIDFYSTAGSKLASAVVKGYDLKAASLTLSAGLSAAVAAGSTVHFGGAYGKEQKGLKSALSETGTLYGISLASNPTFKPNLVYNTDNGQVGGTKKKLSFDRIVDALTILQNRGLEEKLSCFVSPATFNDLMKDEEAFRRYSAESREIKKGVKAIRFYSGANEVEMITHPFVKQGDAFAVPLSKIKRIGSADIAFIGEGKDEGEIFTQHTDRLTWFIRSYTAQSIFVECPNLCLMITKIDNESAT